MFQALLRNWLLGTARQKMREAAMQAAGDAMNSAGAPEQQRSAEKAICHVGAVFALGIEAGGLIDRLAGVIMTEGSGFVAREGGLNGKRVLVVESGVGCSPAARATQALILGHQPRWVISAGFAGGLRDEVARGDILMADQIVAADGRVLEIDFKLDREALSAMPHVHVGRLLTSDRIVREPAEKRSLGQQHNALAVDMESIAVARVCRDEKVRFLAVRVISDAVNHALPRDIDYLVNKRTTAGRLGAAAGAILRRPASFKDMWQLKEDALLASERLANFLTGVIGQLP